MLDRSPQQNLFDPYRLGVSPDDRSQGEPRQDPLTATVATGEARVHEEPDLHGLPRVTSRRRTLTGRLRDRRTRRLIRYTPTTIIALVLLGHHAGCGQPTNPGSHTRQTAEEAPRFVHRPATSSVTTARPVAGIKRAKHSKRRRHVLPARSHPKRHNALPLPATGANTARSAPAPVSFNPPIPPRAVQRPVPVAHQTHRAEANAEFSFEDQ